MGETKEVTPEYMSIFSRKGEEDEEDEYEEEEERRFARKKIKDLKPENKKKRKEPPKPWGKKERYLVLGVLLTTVIFSALLYASARSWKLPRLPKIALPFFGEETIIITKGGVKVEEPQKVVEDFNDKTRELSGIYALYVIRLDSGVSYGVSENELMQAASLIKLPVMSLVYKKSEAGELNLDVKAPGGSLSYEELVVAMGKRSDNSAFNQLVKIFGESQIQKYIDGLGLSKTSIAKNKTTPKDIGLFFEKLWNKEIVSEASRDAILDSMTDTIYEDWIVKGIDDVRVAHKYGREVHVVNDAGIVFTERPFVLVILTQGVIEKEADSVFPELAKLVYSSEKQ